MPLVAAFCVMLVGNYMVADWIVAAYIPGFWYKLLYGTILHLYLPVGAYYFIAGYDEISGTDSRARAKYAFWFFSPAAYFAFVMVITGGHPRGGETVLMLPIIFGLPVLAVSLVVAAIASVAFIPMFYRALVGTSVPRHPAHDIIHSSRQITPSEAADLAERIEGSMCESAGLSKLQLDIRNSRCTKLLNALRQKVDFLVARNKKFEDERAAEVERRTRPERERLEALARSASLDADVAERIVELIRENERRKQNGA